MATGACSHCGPSIAIAMATFVATAAANITGLCCWPVLVDRGRHGANLPRGGGGTAWGQGPPTAAAAAAAAAATSLSFITTGRVR